MDGGGAVVCDAAPASVSLPSVEVSGPVVPVVSVSVTVTPEPIGAGGKV